MTSGFSRGFSQRSLLLAVLTTAGACSDSNDSSIDAPAGGDTGTASVGGSAAGTAPGAGGTTSGGTGGGQAGSGGNANGASGPAGEDDGSGGSSGSEPLPTRLNRYHHAETDRSLHFELDTVEGLAPYASSLEYLAAFVGRALNKPDGIVFDADETLAPAGADHVWTFDALDAFAREHAKDEANGTVSIHVLFVDGSYDSGEDGGTVLGLAWGQRYIALFQDAIRSGCSGGLFAALSTEACQIAERNVWAHEIGHVIGLVDNGLRQQTDHRDADHGRHDLSDGCLMYWAYDRPEMFDVLLTRLNSAQSTDVDFCENCWADLNAARQ
jgi:hypothetical protein